MGPRGVGRVGGAVGGATIPTWSRSGLAWNAASITPGMLGSVAAMFFDTDVRAVLPSVRVPTLVLHRSGDRLVNVRSGRYLAEHIPGARLVEVPGSDHQAYYESPELFLDEIEEFLTGSRVPLRPSAGSPR